MASLYCNNQVRDSCFTNARHGRSCSKAQACLEKILHLISSIPPPCEINPNPFKKRGFDIDLNLRLGSFVDDDDESEEKSDCFAENSFNEEKTGTGEATATDVSSDVTDIQKSEEFKSGTEGEVKASAAFFHDSLDLLIEAAEMISARDIYLNEKKKEVEEVEKSGVGDGRESMERVKDYSVNVVEEGLEEFEDIASPVVRSKRGRSQVLPLRFRDSVLEPWKKRPQRSTATTAAVAVSKKKRNWSEQKRSHKRSFQVKRTPFLFTKQDARNVSQAKAVNPVTSFSLIGYVRDSCFTNARHGRSCSKAQACLEKILHLISSIPPPCEINPNPFKKRGFDIDLNLRLGSFVDDDDESEEKSDCFAENSFNEEKTGTGEATATDVSSDVTDIQKSEEFKSGTEGEVKASAAFFHDSLDLLIEAAEMISARDIYLNEKKKEVEEVEKSGVGDGRESMERVKDYSVNVVEEGLEEFEDIASPVVRSKRGRSQVLPLRFRDSVLEPWKKRPQRSTATTAAVAVSKKKRNWKVKKKKH
ncbi:hypothetical protein GOBAR_AA37654 [Gossypium barbadense]|uniref:Uncharacterized protein n=1 Tax=Gossypium barbadense TaxID=3634 RepID=A0A2P5VW65_GOSBA|nr:hypothetical protein GOBAR_AA37654 [Gossypium barbadense]